MTPKSNKKLFYAITDPFTKYAVVTAITNKDAKTVVDIIYKEWFSKFGIPAQIHTDGGKEFVNKLSAELFQLLNVSHTKNCQLTPHKTVKRFLLSFINHTRFNWENVLPAFILSYNTSYHSPIAT